MGLSSFEQFEDRTTDTVIYGLKKFVTLCLNSNPNVLEILGTKPEHLLAITKEGQLLRDNVDLFLSKKAIQSFGNYATAQLRRLQNALARDNYPQAEKEQHILNSISGQMEHLKRTYKSFTDSEISLYIDQSDKEEMDTVRKGKYSYKDVFQMVDEYERRFKSAAENTSLPDEPDYKRVEELMIEIYGKILS